MRFSMAYTYGKMSLNYASPLHVLSQPISLFNSPRLDRRLDNDLITSAGAAHARMHVQLQISWKPRPRAACLELGCRDTVIRSF